MPAVKLDPSIAEACRLRRQRLISNQQMIDVLNGKPLEARGPRFFGYIRVSSDEQIKNYSLEFQREQINTCFKLKKPVLDGRDHDSIEMGEVFEDAGVSAYKVPFLERPEGGRLHDNLQNGDIVCFYQLNRGFRSLKDFRVTHDLWSEKGVAIILVMEGLDMSTAIGQFVANQFANFAEFESSAKSERSRESAAELRRRRILTSHQIPIGYTVAKDGRGRHRLVPDMSQLVIVPMIVQLREVEGLTYQAISDRIERMQAAEENRPARCISTRLWQNKRVERVYKRRKELLDLLNETLAIEAAEATARSLEAGPAIA